MSDSPAPGRRRRFAPLMIIAGLASALVLSLAMTGTLSAFVATILNSQNTAATGTVILKEVGGSNTCTSTDLTNISTDSATCSTINKYGGSTTMVPSASNTTPTNTVTTTVNMSNTGTAAASSFTLGFGVCTQGNNGTTNGSATDFCSKLHVKIVSGTTTVLADTTAAALAGAATGTQIGTTVTIPAALIPAPGAAAVPFTFTVFVDSGAGNTYQGLSASQPITWTLSS